jgi:hypothetical protein
MVSLKKISDLAGFAFAALIQSFAIADFLSHSLRTSNSRKLSFLRLCFEGLCFVGGIGFAWIAETRADRGLERCRLEHCCVGSSWLRSS